jgi:hypothetical protein
LTLALAGEDGVRLEPPRLLKVAHRIITVFPAEHVVRIFVVVEKPYLVEDKPAERQRWTDDLENGNQLCLS